jgi:DNA primase
MTRDFTDIEDVEARINIVDVIGRYVPLKKRGNEYVGLCPFHGENTPSFTVVPNRPMGKLPHFFKCHGCGAYGGAVTFLRKFNGWDYRTAVLEVGGADLVKRADAERAETSAKLREREKQQAADNERKRRNAYEAWNQAVGAAGTPVEAYLRGRGIAGPIPPSLRYHAKLYCAEVRDDLPAMVGAIVDVRGTFLALHRTYLRRADDGRWVKAALEAPKKVAASYSGGAIRLFPPQPTATTAGRTLYIGEGIETSLSIVEGLRLRPDKLLDAMVWAGVSLTNMSRVVLPMGEGAACAPLRRVVLCMDADMKDLKAAHSVEIHAKTEWESRGVEVRAVYPPAGQDLNDVIQQGPVELGVVA